MATKEYACVKKTKKAFETSLAELARTQQLNKITVKTVCERAQLSRNAFYFHYKDIGALISDIEENLIHDAEDLLADLGNLGFPKNVYATIDGLIDLFESRREVVKQRVNKIWLREKRIISRRTILRNMVSCHHRRWIWKRQF